MWLARSLGSNKSKQPPSPASCSCLSHSLAKGLACPVPTTWVAFTSCTNFGERSELGGEIILESSRDILVFFGGGYTPLSPPLFFFLHELLISGNFLKVRKSWKQLSEGIWRGGSFLVIHLFSLLSCTKEYQLRYEKWPKPRECHSGRLIILAPYLKKETAKVCFWWIQ